MPTSDAPRRAAATPRARLQRRARSRWLRCRIQRRGAEDHPARPRLGGREARPGAPVVVSCRASLRSRGVPRALFKVPWDMHTGSPAASCRDPRQIRVGAARVGLGRDPRFALRLPGLHGRRCLRPTPAVSTLHHGHPRLACTGVSPSSSRSTSARSGFDSELARREAEASRREFAPLARDDDGTGGRAFHDARSRLGGPPRLGRGVFATRAGRRDRTADAPVALPAQPRCSSSPALAGAAETGEIRAPVKVLGSDRSEASSPDWLPPSQGRERPRTSGRGDLSAASSRSISPPGVFVAPALSPRQAERRVVAKAPFTGFEPCGSKRASLAKTPPAGFCGSTTREHTQRAIDPRRRDGGQAATLRGAPPSVMRRRMTSAGARMTSTLRLEARRTSR